MKRGGKSTCVVVPALVGALVLLAPQRTHAFSLCDYIDFALKPFGWCGEEVEVVKAEDPTRLRAEQEIQVKESLARREMPVSLEHSEPQVQSATSQSYDPSLTHNYVSTSDWVEQSSQVNKLLSGIVTYLFGEQRQDSETQNSKDDVEYVSREFLQKQTDRIYDKRSDSFDALSDSFTTSLLTITGSGTLTGSLTAGTYLSAPYLIATDTTATSTLTHLSVPGRTALSGSLTLAALGGGILTTNANGVVSTTTIGAASVTDDSLDFDKLVDAFTLDATATFDLDTNNADWNIDNGTFSVDADTNRVGIGTDIPTQVLTVSGSTTSAISARVGNTNLNGWSTLMVGQNSGRAGFFDYYNDTYPGSVDSFDEANHAALLAGSLASGLNLVAANASADIKFYTGGATENDIRMRIDENGNVGIGTTSPNMKLSITGGGLRVGTNTGDDFGYQVIRDANGAYGATNSLVFRAEQNGGAGYSFQTYNGTVLAQIKNDGNVGIGTTSPQTKLHVFDAGSPADLRIESQTGNSRFDLVGGNGNAWSLLNNNADDTFRIMHDYGSVVTIDADGDLNIGGVGASARLVVTASSTAAIETAFRVNDSLTNLMFEVNNDGTSYFSGNLGIGTTSPSGKLDIKASSEYAGINSFRTPTNSGAFTSGTVGTWLGFSSYGDASDFRGAIGVNNSGNLQINSGSGSGITVLESNGNIGIGTTSPVTKMSVSGDGYITGGLGVGVYNSTDGSILQSDGTRGARIFSDAGVSGNRSILVLDSNASNGIGAGSDYITIARDGNDGVINSAGGSGTLSLQTANTDRLYITNTGNVGIGTTSPISKLHIEGTTDSTLFIDHKGSATGDLAFTAGFAVINSYSNTKPTLALHNAGTGPSLTTTGNVGIGTTSPSQKLEVAASQGGDLVALVKNYGAGRAKLSLDSGGVSTADLAFLRGGTEYWNLKANSNSGFGLYDSNDAVYRWYVNSVGNVGIGDTSPAALLTVGNGDLFQVDSSGNVTVTGTQTMSGSSANIALGSNYLSGDGDDEGVYVDGSGNVGIGTAAPDELLKLVKGGGNASLKIWANSGGAYNPQIKFADGNSETVQFTIGVDNGGVDQGEHAFKIYSGDNIEGSSEFVINTAGNVGIGTTSPASKLDVYGDLRVGTRTSGSYRYLDFTAGSASANIQARRADTAVAVDLTLQTAGGNTLLNPTSGNVGIGTTSPTFKLSVAGTIGPDADDSYNLGAAGSDWGCLYYNSGTLGTCASDERLKENIETLSFSTDKASALDQVAALSLHTFSFKEAPGSQYKGLIAQEVLEVAPELVLEREDGFLAVKYGDIQWLVLEAMQEMWRSLQANFARDDEQDAELEYLRERVTALEEELGLETLAETEEQDSSSSDPEPSSSNDDTPVQPASTDESESASSTESIEDAESQASSTEYPSGLTALPA